MAAKTAKSKLEVMETKGGRAVTSYDVARKAGVSQSAVSRCFKPGASVSKKMREKVMKVANELGYEPNAIARSLITRRSNLVAVIISNLTNLYYPEVLAQISQRLSERGIRVLLFALDAEGHADEALNQIWQYQVDGVISAAKLTDEQLAAFDKRQKPLVFYNRFYSNQAVNAVCCDQAEGARHLVNGLVEAGHKSFGIIGGPDDSVVGQERTDASLQRLRELGITDVTVSEGSFSYECGGAGIEVVREKRGDLPDAIICVNDMTAIGAIDALRYGHGKKVPEDISVVGFDGVAPSAWSSFDLTTMRQPVGRMTEGAVAMLMDRIENPDLPPEKRLFAGVVVDGTSAKFVE